MSCPEALWSSSRRDPSPRYRCPISSHLCRGTAKNPPWLGDRVSLAEVGTIQMEFLYLAKLARDASFSKKPSHVMDVLDQQEKKNGLYPVYLHLANGGLIHNSK